MTRGRKPRSNHFSHEAESRLGYITERIKALREKQTDDQRQWLDLAEGGLVIATATMDEAIQKERLAHRQIGSIEYFYEMASKGEPWLHRRAETT
jgi:hypothetical protein